MASSAFTNSLCLQDLTCSHRWPWIWLSSGIQAQIFPEERIGLPFATISVCDNRKWAWRQADVISVDSWTKTVSSSVMVHNETYSTATTQLLAMKWNSNKQKLYSVKNRSLTFGWLKKVKVLFYPILPLYSKEHSFFAGVTRWCSCLRHYKPERRVFDSRWSRWNFSLTRSFRPHYGPGVDSVSDRNE